MPIPNRLRLPVLLCVCIVGLTACSVSQPPAASLHNKPTVSTKTLPAAGAPGASDQTYIEMRNVVFRVLPNVALSIQRLTGLMMQSRAGQIISLDDPSSFTMQMQSARSSISSHDLSALVNSYILPRAGTPIRDLTMNLNPDQTVTVTGTFHKLVDLHFQSKATLQVTPNGNMRMDFYDMRVGRILHQSILDFLGLKVAEVAHPKNARIFRVEGNDMIFPVSEMFPPPRIEGKLQSLSIVKGRLNFVFGGTAASDLTPPETAANYIFFHGGSMRFGRLTMTPVDMELVNLKPASAFEFSLQKYFQQLTAGYSKSLPNGGLLVHMANYRDVVRNVRTR